MKHRIMILYVVLALGAGLGFAQEVRANHIDVITITDTINPAIYEYIAESIARANQENAECIVIQLDTPGGLLTSTQKIVQEILNSEIPVIVYISPRGSWAASAGTFITLASHVAAMAPSTNIGAAHPVSITPSGSDRPADEPESKETADRIEKKLDQFMKQLAPSNVEKRGKSAEKEESTAPDVLKDDEIEEDEAIERERPQSDQDIMSEKIINNTTAWIRGIAQYRGRNAEWAEKAVTESLSITETEALEKNVIDIVAEDLSDLLEQVHGRVVKVGKEEVTLDTDKIQINTYEMSFRQKVLSIISNPNIFFLLILMGIGGIGLELYNPGLILPGVVGGISIILVLYASQVLPVNYAAVLLILLALILFIAEVKITSYGLLTVGGVICIALGGLMLFGSGSGLPGSPFRVAYSTIITVTVVLLAFVFLVLERIFRVHSMVATTGAQGLVGKIGEVRSEIDPQGNIFVHGELWNATSEVPIRRGAKVEILDIEGLTLKVKEHIIP